MSEGNNIKPLVSSIAKYIESIMESQRYLREKMTFDLMNLGITACRVGDSGLVEYVDPLLPENIHLFKAENESSKDS